MPESLPVDGTPDRADFALKLGGADVEASVRLDVLEIDVSEEVGRHARATLLVNNWSSDTREVRYSDGELFRPGTDVELSMGWQSELVPVFAGVISAVTGHFGAESGPTLEVACRSRSILLAGAPRARVYEDTTDGDVASDLASRYDLTADTADGIQQPQVAWTGTTDWDWLVARAARLGWAAYVRDRDLVFRPAAAPSDGDIVLAYGTTLRELHVEQELAGRVDPAEVAAWSSEELEPVTAEADSARAEPPSGDRPVPGDALDDAGWPLHDAHVGTPAEVGAAEVDRIAVAAASEQVLRHFHGTGRTIGVPRLRIDSWLKLDGIGTRLGGKHYLTAVRHRLGRKGFTTEFQVGRPARLLPPPADVAPQTGLALGLVDDLDDPLGQGRVKVRFPWLTEAEPVWARLSTLDAGPDQGTWFVPDKGQEVLVAHVGGDLRFPVVLGALWNGQQQPPEQMEAANAIRAIVTRSGHRLRFDDADSGSVTLETAGGHTFVLDDSAGEITLSESGGAASVKLGGDGITLEATSGDITISAPSGKVKVDASGFEASSTGPAKVTSSATLDLTASATLTASGAMVRIN